MIGLICLVCLAPKGQRPNAHKAMVVPVQLPKIQLLPEEIMDAILVYTRVVPNFWSATYPFDSFALLSSVCRGFKEIVERHLVKIDQAMVHHACWQPDQQAAPPQTRDEAHDFGQELWFSLRAKEHAHRKIKEIVVDTVDFLSNPKKYQVHRKWYHTRPHPLRLDHTLFPLLEFDSMEFPGNFFAKIDDPEIFGIVQETYEGMRKIYELSGNNLHLMKSVRNNLQRYRDAMNSYQEILYMPADPKIKEEKPPTTVDTIRERYKWYLALRQGGPERVTQ